MKKKNTRGTHYYDWNYVPNDPNPRKRKQNDMKYCKELIRNAEEDKY